MENLAATGGVPGPGRIGRVAIGDLLKRAARRFPDRIALTDGARRVTLGVVETMFSASSGPAQPASIMERPRAPRVQRMFMR